MSTRGIVGFVVDGQEKLSYNHSDSYPSGLGADVLCWLEGHIEGGFFDADTRHAVSQVRLVDEGGTPSAEDIERLSKFHNGGVSTGEPTEWYSLLRHTQGDLDRIIEAGVIIDYAVFATDSLFCEWGYVIDLDERRFEVYQGFQKSPHQQGRFANREASHRASGDYYPIRLVASWSFSELPTTSELLSLEEEE